MKENKQALEMPEEILTSLEDISAELVDLQELIISIAALAEDSPPLGSSGVSEQMH